MKIIITRRLTGAVNVHLCPSWLGRVFGAEDRYLIAMRRSGVWREIGTWTPVGSRIERAIARELAISGNARAGSLQQGSMQRGDYP